MTEDVVEPLISGAKKRVKRVYRPLSKAEIFQRCVRLSREIAAGKGSLHNNIHLERQKMGGRAPRVCQTPECGCLNEKSLKSGSKKAGLPRTSGTSGEPVEAWKGHD